MNRIIIRCMLHTEVEKIYSAIFNTLTEIFYDNANLSLASFSNALYIHIYKL